MASSGQGGQPFFVGQLVKVWIDGINKRCVRRAIVTAVATTGIEVTYGQSEKWPVCGCPHFVTQHSLLGSRLDLKNDTYFCDAQTVPLHYVTRVMSSVCPSSDLKALEAVAIDARRRLAQARAARQAVAQRTSSGQQQPQQQQQAQNQSGKSDPNDDSNA